MAPTRHSEVAFETVIEDHLLHAGYMGIDRDDFDRERAIFPETVLAFVRETQARWWAKWDNLCAATEHTIALLKDRRAALIAAAVTGRIDLSLNAQQEVRQT